MWVSKDTFIANRQRDIRRLELELRDARGELKNLKADADDATLEGLLKEMVDELKLERDNDRLNTIDGTVCYDTVLSKSVVDRFISGVNDQENKDVD